MEDRELIEGLYDQDGKELHYLDIVLYNDEKYIIMKQKDAPYIILHPIGRNYHTRDLDLNSLNYATIRVDE